MDETEETNGGSMPTGGGKSAGKYGNALQLWGNKQSMNLNSLVLENIICSPYFKNHLSQLKTYHEVIDEIYYNVAHLEPWERGTRRQLGNSGARAMEVRGVGAGGVVSSSFCCLYKLFTLKLTRKQVIGLMEHPDSCYIRGLGFMFVRYTQAPDSLWDWFEPYLDDDEQIDPKAGGGDMMIIGQMLKLFLTKLDWYSTLFPRIPVPVQKDIDAKLRERSRLKLEEARGNSNLQREQFGSSAASAPSGARSAGDDHFQSRSSRERDREGAHDQRRSHSRGHDRRPEPKRSRSPAHRSGSKERRSGGGSSSYGQGGRRNDRSHRSRSRDDRHESRTKDHHHHHHSDSKDRHYSHEHKKKHKHRSRSRS